LTSNGSLLVKNNVTTTGSGPQAWQGKEATLGFGFLRRSTTYIPVGAPILDLSLQRSIFNKSLLKNGNTDYRRNHILFQALCLLDPKS